MHCLHSLVIDCRRRFRLKWPWEQDRQMALYNRSSDFIQVASQPGRPHLSLSPDWCLSHLPKANCFVQHFCENQSSKKRMMSEYKMDGDLQMYESFELPSYALYFFDKLS